MSLKFRGGEAVQISTYKSLKYDWASLGAQKQTQKAVGLSGTGKGSEQKERNAGQERAEGVWG